MKSVFLSIYLLLASPLCAWGLSVESAIENLKTSKTKLSELRMQLVTGPDSTREELDQISRDFVEVRELVATALQPVADNPEMLSQVTAVMTAIGRIPKYSKYERFQWDPESARMQQSMAILKVPDFSSVISFMESSACSGKLSTLQ